MILQHMGPVVKACVHCERELPPIAARCIYCCATQPVEAVTRTSAIPWPEPDPAAVAKARSRMKRIDAPKLRCVLCGELHLTRTCVALTTATDEELEPIADRCYAVGELDLAAALYGRLAVNAKGGDRLELWRDETKEEAREAARREKPFVRFRQRQGGILETQGDRKRALIAYEDAFRIDPEDIATLHALGALYIQLHRWDKARTVYQDLADRSDQGHLPWWRERSLPRSQIGVSLGDVYLALSRCHIQLGAVPTAARCFLRGLTVDPENQRLRETLAQLSDTSLDTAMRADMSPEDRAALALIQSAAQNLNVVAGQPRPGPRAARPTTPPPARPTPPPVSPRSDARWIEELRRYGRTREANRDLPGALAAFENVLAVRPDDVVAMSDAGRLYFATGQWENAQRIYDKLVESPIDIRTGVTKAEAYWALGNIHVKLDHADIAMTMFDRGLGFEPNNRHLKAARARLLAEQGRPSDTLPMDVQSVLSSAESLDSPPLDIDGAPIARAILPDNEIPEVAVSRPIEITQSEVLAAPENEVTFAMPAAHGSGSSRTHADTNPENLFHHADVVGAQIHRVRATHFLEMNEEKEIYAAEHVITGRPYTLTVFPHHLSSMAQEAEQERRARRAAQVDDPSVVFAEDIGRVPDGRLCIVVPGQTFIRLATMLAWRRDQRASEKELIDLFIRVAHGLAKLHAHGEVHQELRPETIHVSYVDRRVIPMIGAANLDALDTPWLRAGVAAYVSPEQATNLQRRREAVFESIASAGEERLPDPVRPAEQIPLDGRSDIYSLGVVMYRTFAGVLPFEGETFDGTLAQHTSATPTPVHERAANLGIQVPAPLARIIDQCLCKRPKERFADAAALAAALRVAQEQMRLDEVGHVGMFEAVLASLGDNFATCRRIEAGEACRQACFRHLPHELLAPGHEACGAEDREVTTASVFRTWAATHLRIELPAIEFADESPGQIDLRMRDLRWHHVFESTKGLASNYPLYVHTIGLMVAHMAAVLRTPVDLVCTVHHPEFAPAGDRKHELVMRLYAWLWEAHRDFGGVRALALGPSGALRVHYRNKFDGQTVDGYRGKVYEIHDALCRNPSLASEQTEHKTSRPLAEIMALGIPVAFDAADATAQIVVTQGAEGIDVEFRGRTSATNRSGIITTPA